MTTPQQGQGDPREDDEQHGLEEIERPTDDPQTRPALDPEISLAERRTPEDR